MRTWETLLSLEQGGDQPLFERIAAVITEDIARGRLRPGQKLPSTRALAEQLGVNRKTVVAAFDRLRHDGRVEVESTGGTRVARTPPRARPRDAPPEDTPGFDLPTPPPARRTVPRHPGMRLLLGGVPDLRLVPTRELARAYRDALRGLRGRRALDYGTPQGSERLRIALGEMLSRTRGIPASPSEICVVRGSQHGLYLVARALLKPGDVVVVESPGYPPAWRALQLAGAEIVPLPVDREGVDVDALEDLCATRPIRAVMVTPHHQYPTTVTLSPGRRARLMALAARNRFFILEDDYDFEFHFDGPPILPLAAADPHHVVVYVATMSKTLAPGLRLGYVVAHPAVIDTITRYRTWVDHQGDQVVEHAVAALLEDGAVARHARRVRRIYRARRDALVEALRAALPAIELEIPRGGMALWARLPGVDTTEWAARALAADVAFQSGGSLRFDGVADDHVRLGFAACTEEELGEAVGRMVAVLGR